MLPFMATRTDRAGSRAARAKAAALLERATLTPSDVAERVGRSRSAVARWLDAKVIQADVRTPSGRYLFTPETVEAIAQRMREAATAAA